jgi:hypothetical protein
MMGWREGLKYCVLYHWLNSGACVKLTPLLLMLMRITLDCIGRRDLLAA